MSSQGLLCQHALKTKVCKSDVLSVHMTGHVQVAEMTGAKIDELKALIQEHK